MAALLIEFIIDPRHCELTVLDGTSSASAFGAWSMAFDGTTGLDALTMPGYSKFLANGFRFHCVRPVPT